MNTPDSLDALRRANPRSAEGFDHLVGAAALDVRARIAADPAPRSRPTGRAALTVRSSRGVAVGALLAAALAAAAVLTVVSPTGGPGVGDAAAAMKQAATVTAASAELSGTAVVRLAHEGETWSDTTMRWNGGDLAVTSNLPDREGRTGGGLRLVDGTLYGRDPRDGVWVAEGSPANIDPESGTTPAEYLAALREDVGGTTLQRIVGSMTGLSTTARRRIDPVRREGRGRPRRPRARLQGGAVDPRPSLRQRRSRRGGGSRGAARHVRYSRRRRRHPRAHGPLAGLELHGHVLGPRHDGRPRGP
jgi:hypothetical protein